MLFVNPILYFTEEKDKDMHKHLCRYRNYTAGDCLIQCRSCNRPTYFSNTLSNEKPII